MVLESVLEKSREARVWGWCMLCDTFPALYWVTLCCVCCRFLLDPFLVASLDGMYLSTLLPRAVVISMSVLLL